MFRSSSMSQCANKGNIMAQPDLIFIHMTDVHILDEGADPFLGLDTAAKLRDAIQYIKGMGVQPAFFAISGDLVQDSDDGAYTHLKQILSDLDSFGVPILLALGNHDNRASFQRIFLNDTTPDESRRYYHSHIFADYKVIVLDTRESGQVYGTLDAPQLDWLRAELADGLPAILIFHHPPVIAPYSLVDDHILMPESVKALGETIAGQNVIGILNGHIHFNSVAAFQGVPVFAGGHVAFMLDPYEKEGMRFLDASGFNVVTVTGGLFAVNPIIMPGEQKTTLHLSTEKLAQLAAQHSK